MDMTIFEPDADPLATGEKVLATATGVDQPGGAPQELTTVLDIMARIFRAV